MPGFLVEIKKSKPLKNFGRNEKAGLVNETMEGKKYYVERRTINKFLDDKVFHENDSYIVVTEGVILNSLSLIQKYGKKDLFHTVIEMYLENGDAFFKGFRGRFSGLLYDKSLNKWLIYTNHYGDKQIFYAETEEGYIIGSEINYLVEYMKNNEIDYGLDVEAAYFLLTYGYMLDDYTLFKQIRKLIAGHVIKMDDDGFGIIRYYKPDNKPDESITEDEIIERVDALFRNAVKLEFEKDLEYGYKHVAELSGGLDSRMTVWVAHNMGYKDVLDCCYSQSNCLEERIAKDIASDLGHEYIFKFLDNGNYLKNIEDTTKKNFGSCHYSISAQQKSLFDLLDLKDYGVLHTGLLGPVLKSYYKIKSEVKGSGYYSSKLLDRVKYENLREYDSEWGTV